MNLFRVTAGLAFSAIVLTTAASAQTPQPAPSQPQTVLHAQATTVVLDVVVTEKGQPVHGIDRTRFHIFEDGTEQAITFVDEHTPEKAAAPAKRNPLPPHYYTNLPLQPRGSAVNVLLLDALNTPTHNQMEVRRQMIKYLETIEPGTTMAIFTLTSRLRMIQGFTSSAGDLVAALKSAKANPRQSIVLDPDSGSGFDTLIGNAQIAGIPGPDMGAIQAFQSDVESAQTDQRVAITIEALQQLARYLGNVPGRKNLLWFSGSFPIVVGAATIENPSAGLRNYSDQLRATTDLLAAARVAVYPMDAQGLATPGMVDFDLGNIGLGPPPQRNPDNGPRFAMEEIAAQTGGQAIFNTNLFASAIAAAVNDGAAYYTIAYVPQSKDFHGQFRKFKVRVDNCSCQLTYRAGYFADPPGKPGSAMQASLMAGVIQHGAPPSSQVLFQTRVLPASDPTFKDDKLPDVPAGEMAASLKKPTQRFVVDLAVDPRTLTFAQPDAGDRQGALEFTLVAYDADGKRLNYLDREVQIRLSSAQYAQVMASGVPVRMTLDVPAGQSYLMIAVHDRLGVRVGSLEIPVTAP